MNASPILRSAQSGGLGKALLSIAFIAAVLLPCTATSAANDGRLLIKRSPTLGHNVTIAIMIDGKPAGTVRRGQTYEKHLTAGQHTLIASPNRSLRPWQATLNVRAGETYSYTASYNTDELVLTPAAVSR